MNTLNTITSAITAFISEIDAQVYLTVLTFLLYALLFVFSSVLVYMLFSVISIAAIVAIVLFFACLAIYVAEYS